MCQRLSSKRSSEELTMTGKAGEHGQLSVALSKTDLTKGIEIVGRCETSEA